MATEKPVLLRTVREVVDAFGGTTATARWAGINKSAVSNWLAENEIPPQWHYPITEALRENNYEISPKVFGFAAPKEKAS